MLTFDQLIFLLGGSFDVKRIIVKFFDHEFVLLEAFVGDVEDGVFIGRFVVHVKDYVSFGDWDNVGDVLWFWFDSVFADWNMHISSVSLQ